MISTRKVQNVGGGGKSVGDVQGTYRGQSITLVRNINPKTTEMIKQNLRR
ncbi:MAG: hypothetical protein LBG09_01875 [Puniceicoccales bacterium]|nr:hypothetical protein [Puniceicoccales bacterium]